MAWALPYIYILPALPSPMTLLPCSAPPFCDQSKLVHIIPVGYIIYQKKKDNYVFVLSGGDSLAEYYSTSLYYGQVFQTTLYICMLVYIYGTQQFSFENTTVVWNSIRAIKFVRFLALSVLMGRLSAPEKKQQNCLFPKQSTRVCWPFITPALILGWFALTLQRLVMLGILV